MIGGGGRRSDVQRGHDTIRRVSPAAATGNGRAYRQNREKNEGYEKRARVPELQFQNTFPPVRIILPEGGFLPFSRPAGSVCISSMLTSSPVCAAGSRASRAIS